MRTHASTAWSLREAGCGGSAARAAVATAKSASAAAPIFTRRIMGSGHPCDLIEEFYETEGGAVVAQDLRVGAFDQHPLVRRVGARAAAETELPGGQRDRGAGEDVARPGARKPRIERSVDARLSVGGELGLDQR